MTGLIAITGANGNLGMRSISTLGVDRVRALVRSERAKQDLLARFESLDVWVVDYTDANSLTAALKDCETVVHLVGIIKQTRHSSYENAHERSCAALVEALPASIQHLVYLSIVGSHADSDNACLASKGRAEDILLEAATAVVVLQVPMVLGEGDYASAALKRNASKKRAMTFRAASLEQPIYAGDVVAAIQAAANLRTSSRLQLAGPESLSRSELIQRAAAIYGNKVQVTSLPVGLGMVLAWCFERLANPPVTRAMLGVLDHDDNIDSQAAIAQLGINLTPLDEMLQQVL
jgi:NADH dehydrogenase